MPSFEESLKKLETIVEQLEKGDLAWKNRSSSSKKAWDCLPPARQELDAAEGKVQMLVKQRDGSLKAEPFPAEKKG